MEIFEHNQQRLEAGGLHQKMGESQQVVGRFLLASTL